MLHGVVRPKDKDENFVGLLILIILIFFLACPSTGNGITQTQKDNGSLMAEPCEKDNVSAGWLKARKMLWTTNRHKTKPMKGFDVPVMTLKEILGHEAAKTVHRHTGKVIASGHFVDLKGARLKVGVLPAPLLLKYNTTTRSYSGYCWEILLELATRLNFTFSIVQPNDGHWGVLKNNTWNGLVGMLDRKEVDLVAMPLTEMSDRSESIDFACTIREFDAKLSMLDPRLRREKWLIIFDILSLPVSCLLGLSLIFGVLFHSFTSAAFTRESEKRFSSRFCSNLFSFAGTLMNQGSAVLPVTVTGRTFLSFWWWFSLLLGVMYSGNMIATLADTRAVYPFTTIGQMLNQDEYKWGYNGNSSIQSYMESVQHQLRIIREQSDMHFLKYLVDFGKGSSSPLIQRLQKSVEQFAMSDPSVISQYMSVHISKMETEKYVFIGDTLPFMGSANFFSFREIIFSKRECFGLPLNSPLTGPVQNVISHLDNFGILKFLLKTKTRTENKRRGLPADNSNRTVDFKQVKSVYYVTIIGISISAFILCMEILINSRFVLNTRSVCEWWN